MVTQSFEIFTLAATQADINEKTDVENISQKNESESTVSPQPCTLINHKKNPAENTVACLDDVYTLLGWMGPYHKLQCFLLTMPIVDSAIHLMAFIFIGRLIDHKCAEPRKSYSKELTGNASQSYPSNILYDDFNTSQLVAKRCSLAFINQSRETVFSACSNGYEYSEPQDRSVTSEWNLVCEKEPLSDMSQTIFSIGMMFGAFLCTVLADKFGRKPTYVVSHVLLLCVAILTAFSPDFATFLVFRFLLGALQQGTALASWVLILELILTSKRGWLPKVCSFVWSGGLLLLGLICYLCREMSWRHTQIVLAAISCYSLAQWCLVDESLRWLTAKGKTFEAERIISKAAKRNKVDSLKVLEKYREVIRSSSTMDSHLTKTSKTSNGIGTSPRRTTQSNFSAFAKSKPILKVTAIMCYLWLIDSLTYMSLTLTSPSRTDNFFLGYSKNILAELPAAVFFSIFIDRIGRRYCAIAAHLIAGVSLTLVVVLSNIPAAATIPGVHVVIMISSLLAKFGISFGFVVLWLYTPELFPTSIRTTGYGLASFFSRIGGMAAPYSRTLSHHYPCVPGVVLSVLCLTVPLMVKFLPETHGHDLLQTAAEMEEWLEDNQRQRERKSRGYPVTTDQSVEDHHV